MYADGGQDKQGRKTYLQNFGVKLLSKLKGEFRN
jgi:hypothetical protein